MSKGLVERSSLEAIANAIREKNGNSDTYTPAQMGPAISAITAGDNIDHEDLPAYVKAEALAVAERVKTKLKSDSIVILTGSDSHQIETGTNAANTMAGNLHAGMAMKALTYMLPIDFAAYLGDYTAGSNTTGIEEGLGHFASINNYIDEAFRGLPQFRTVGNHDPLGYSYS
jgi:tRNA A37 threonylcarbamoyladenosine modification protein TsaB